MKTRKAKQEYCQWHETMETKAECAMKPTIERKPQHTPTPWKMNIKSPYSVHIESENAPESRLHICKMDTYAGGKNPKFLEADAAFIVRAVNSHEELLGAAKLAMETIRKNGELTDALVHAHNALDKAIAKAEGKDK